jgi:hypothetical protein
LVQPHTWGFFYYMYKVSQFRSHIPNAIPSSKSLIYIPKTTPISIV